MLLTTALMSTSAHAISPMIHVEGQGTFLQIDDSSPALGWGIGARVGIPVDLMLITLVPEAGLTVWTPGDLLFVPEVGVRTSFGKLVEPGLYAHLLIPIQDGIQPGWDAGVSLEVTAVPKIDFGVQGGLVSLGQTPAVTGGLTVGIKL